VITAPVPSELPELRRDLARMWAPGRPFWLVAHTANPRLGGGHDDYNPTSYASWEFQQLDRAQLMWVCEPMCDLLQAAALSVPGEVVGTELTPAPAGFAVFEKPYQGISADGSGEGYVTVNAIVWGTTQLPPLDGYPDGTPAFTISSYEMIEEPVPGSGMRGRLWAPLGRSDWPVHDRLDLMPWPMHGQAHASFMEDRRILAALFTLLAQPGLATVTDNPHQRHVRRQLDRAGIPRTAQVVRMVTLRELRAPSGPPRCTGCGTILRDDVASINGIAYPTGQLWCDRCGVAVEPDEHRFTHRWIVRGHWRNQPFGKGRKQRRLQWIAPYIKGPVGTDVVVPEEVQVWKR